MQELSMNEIEQVSGGLDLDTGGLAIVGLAFVGAPVVTVVGAAALGIGLGMLAADMYLKYA